MDLALPNLQAVLPLAACLLSVLSAQAIFLRAPGERANQLATLLVAGAAWWGFCQTLWTLAPDAATAYFWHHLAGPGWAFIGPLGLHLIAQHALPPRWMRRAIPPAYAIAAIFALLQLTTSWLHVNAFRTPLGWGFESGPGHVAFLFFTFGCVIPAIYIALRRVSRAASPAQRRQVRLVAAAFAAPFLLAGLTGGVLPVFGIQLPRLGSVSFGIFGAVIAWSYHRYGFSALAPATFSREILATLPNGLALVGLNGEGLSGNRQMAQLLGIDHSALIDHPIGDAFDDPVLDPPRELREHECRLRSRSGDELAVSVSTSVLRDKLGLPIGIVIVVRDLRELVELRNHLVTSARLAAVGELAAGIAHEINNPIAFVRANLTQLQQSWESLAKRLPEETAAAPDGVDMLGEGRELLEECIDGVERTIRIVQDVKGFAHAGGEEREALDLNELLVRVLRIAQPQVSTGIRVDSDLGEIPPVLGNRQHLQQVFLNLLINAIQAIEGEGRVLVETRVEEGGVIASVSDDGHGIAPEIRERIFDPFFTTKPVGEGTGLGLAISFRIIASHDAQLCVESEPGRGTRFTVRFPPSP